MTRLRLCLRLAFTAGLVSLPSSGCFLDAPRLPPRDELRPVVEHHGRRALANDPDLARRLLALDPENVQQLDVEQTLARGPTPWLFTIAPVQPWAHEFKALLRFFTDMGYPEDRIGDPRVSRYKMKWKNRDVTGMAAWFYEQDGMSPMVVGWSGGAIQTVVTLHYMSNTTGEHHFTVIDARTGETLQRDWVLDPYTGEKRPITELQFSFSASLAAGGLGRLVRGSKWEIDEGLRQIPDSTRDFVGFSVPGDFFGSDRANKNRQDFIEANSYQATGTASVRSIIASRSYGHFNTVHCERLSRTSQGRAWLDSYRPYAANGVLDLREIDGAKLVKGTQNVWCGEIWYAIRKNWTIEAQRVASGLLKLERRTDGP